MDDSSVEQGATAGSARFATLGVESVMRTSLHDGEHELQNHAEQDEPDDDYRYRPQRCRDWISDSGLACEQPFDERPAVSAPVGPGLVRDLCRDSTGRAGHLLHVSERISEACDCVSGLATLVAMADADEVVGLRLLRAILDLSV